MNKHIKFSRSFILFLFLLLFVAMSSVAAQEATPEVEPTVAVEQPTLEPTAIPTEAPTIAPTQEPTVAPTEEPTTVPTQEPTIVPTEAPAETTPVVTVAPTEEPTEAPVVTVDPTDEPAETTPEMTEEPAPVVTIVPTDDPVETTPEVTPEVTQEIVPEVTAEVTQEPIAIPEIADGERANQEARASLDPLEGAMNEDGTMNLIVVLNLERRFMEQAQTQEQAPQTDAEAEAGSNDTNAAEISAIRAAQNELMAQMAPLGAVSIREYTHFPMMAIQIPGNALSTLQSLSVVESIQANRRNFHALGTSTDIIGVDDPDGFGPRVGTWSEGYDGSGYSIAVLDNGFDTDHTFISNKIIAEACFSGAIPFWSSSNCQSGALSDFGTDASSNEWCDANTGSVCSHGTHVAGIAAGNNNSVSFDGVARGADLVTVNVFSTYFDGSTTAWDADILAGLEYVYDNAFAHNIVAANLSLGGSAYTTACDYAIPAYVEVTWRLRSRGVAVIAASGNEYWANAISTPACASNIISVGATNDDDNVPLFSNGAYFLDLVAPGEAIQSSYPRNIFGDQYASFDGTSMATPHVAGAWAIMRQRSPEAGVGAILESLKNTGTYVYEPFAGLYFRRINVDLAIDNGMINMSNTSSHNTTTPTLTWGAAANAQWYNIYTVDELGTVVNEWVTANEACSGSSCSYRPTAQVSAYRDDDVYWYIRAYSTSYATSYGPWIGPVTFNVESPIRQGPLGMMTSNNGLVTWEWDTYSGASHYQLYAIDQFGNVIINTWLASSEVCNTFTGDCDYSPNYIHYEGTTYYWYMRSYGSDGFSTWRSNAYDYSISASPPSAPSSFSYNVNGGDVSMGWSDNAPWYYVRVTRNGINYIDQWFNRANSEVFCFLGFCSLRTGDLGVYLPNGNYTAELYAYGAGGISSASSYTMTVNLSPPSQPSLSGMSVSNNEFLGNSFGYGVVEHSWSYDTNTSYYRLYLIRNGFVSHDRWYRADQICITFPVTSCSVTTSNYIANGTYNWYVMAWNSAGASSWSNAAQYTVSQDMPQLTAQSTTGGVDPVFTVRKDSGAATWYEFYIYSYTTNSIVYNQWITSTNCGSNACTKTFDLDVFLYPGNYVWYVRGYGAYGYGPWSNGQEFTVNPPSPNTPTLIAPSSGYVDTDASVLFEWNNNNISNGTVNASWFNIEILDYNDNIVTDVWAWCDTTQCSYWMSNLPSGNYLWRVWAWNTQFSFPSAQRAITILP